MIKYLLTLSLFAAVNTSIANVPTNLLSIVPAFRTLATSQIIARAYGIKKSHNPEGPIENLLRQENLIVSEINKLEKRIDELVDIENGEQCFNPGKSYSYETKICAEKKEKLQKKLDWLREKLSNKVEAIYCHPGLNDLDIKEKKLWAELQELDMQYQVACRNEEAFDVEKYQFHRKQIREEIKAVKDEKAVILHD
jgi:hypothetical protein